MKKEKRESDTQSFPNSKYKISDFGKIFRPYKRKNFWVKAKKRFLLPIKKKKCLFTFFTEYSLDILLANEIDISYVEKKMKPSPFVPVIPFLFCFKLNSVETIRSLIVLTPIHLL